MFRIVVCNMSRVSTETLRPLKRLTPALRHIGDDTQTLIGGGLEKLQGGLKEESYFRTKNYDLMTRIREQGSKLKCEDCLGNWTEFEKVLTTNEALRDTCSANKHKNCLEEAFFMNEHNECAQLMKDKLLSRTNFEDEDFTTQGSMEDQPQLDSKAETENKEMPAK